MSVRPALVLGLGVLCLAPAGAAFGTLDQAMVATQSPIAVGGKWATGMNEAIWMLCTLVDCPNYPIDHRSAGDDLSVAVQGVIDAYRSSGVVEGLTPAELDQGVLSVDYTLGLLADPDVTLDPGLTAEFCGALVEIRADLVARQ